MENPEEISGLNQPKDVDAERVEALESCTNFFGKLAPCDDFRLSRIRIIYIYPGFLFETANLYSEVISVISPSSSLAASSPDIDF